MSHLTRTSAAGLQLEMLLPWTKLLKSGGWSTGLSPSSRNWNGDLVKVFLSPEEATEVRFGRFIKLDQTDQELAAFEGDTLLAILEKKGQSLQAKKGFWLV